ncbi:MAG: VOC family protein [Thaumarchaeota archaeon]|mgnify:FL=1|jgi:lactoylglutathione lyase|nr:VOC family protein [Nitrososphaerota archaeon]MBT3744183.1 VOC family protein [Nitrososphaerota archaeon]MBT4057745.1 VOC family protein [Nitrososphaerota archaeon]MBT4175555.1 VOC family protein [Nitrososphaerota archaeon]MBT4509618.1 VOC family protein [Nitrososphaerota archaeon]
MNIKRIGNIILEVKDLDTSIKFYHDILGMPIKNERRNWVDLGQQSGGTLSLHPASITTSHTSTSKENGILIGLTVGDLNSAIDELSDAKIEIFREVQERQAGKNVIILDPDGYMISLFEPDFSENKEKQTSGYVGFTPE